MIAKNVYGCAQKKKSREKTSRRKREKCFYLACPILKWFHQYFQFEFDLLRFRAGKKLKMTKLRGNRKGFGEKLRQFVEWTRRGRRERRLSFEKNQLRLRRKASDVSGTHSLIFSPRKKIIGQVSEWIEISFRDLLYPHSTPTFCDDWRCYLKHPSTVSYWIYTTFTVPKIIRSTHL